MADSITMLKETLKSSGSSLTTPRKRVFLALQDSEPQSMNQLVRSLGGIDRSSIYRTIDLFVQLGIVERLQIGWKYKLELSDKFGHHHHHLNCMTCGISIPVPEDPSLEALLHKLSVQKDFYPSGHQLEIRGTCKKCMMKA